MRVTIFGSGYVGLVTGACLADAGNDVLCVDVDAQKIEGLKRGEIPIHEPGLDALIKSNQLALQELATPEARALPGWIQARAKARQIGIESRAVQMLADFVGPNLRQLDNELEKLALYAGKRTITVRDSQHAYLYTEVK